MKLELSWDKFPGRATAGGAGGDLVSPTGRLPRIGQCGRRPRYTEQQAPRSRRRLLRSEEHTSELQSLMRNTYAVFCLKKKKKQNKDHNHTTEYRTSTLD